MRNYNETDIRFYDLKDDIEGDFIVDESGDFAVTEAYESARQDIVNRVRTQKGEWRSHQNIGADLELLEGEPNTRETGDRGTHQIYESLTFDDRFAIEDVNVRAVPTSIEHIDYYIMLDADGQKPLVLHQGLDLL